MNGHMTTDAAVPIGWRRTVVVARVALVVVMMVLYPRPPVSLLVAMMFSVIVALAIVVVPAGVTIEVAAPVFITVPVAVAETVAVTVIAVAGIGCHSRRQQYGCEQS